MKIGRNDPCPCGSGLKYKKCCMNKTEGVPRKSRSSLTWDEAAMEYSMLQAGDMIPFGKQMTADERSKAMEDILKGCPDFYPALFEIGVHQLMNDDTMGCFKSFDRSLDIMKDRDEIPDDIVNAINSICEVLEKYFMYRDASGYYERILDLQTDGKRKAAALSDMANCCFYLGEHDRALEYAERAVSMKPDSSTQLSNLGWIWMVRGELGPAKEILKRAVEMDSEDPIARGNLKACNMMRKKHLKDWNSFLLKGLDRKVLDKLADTDDDEGYEMERRTYNSGMIRAFRLHLARDDSRTQVEKYDLFFSLTYALDILDRVNMDESIIFSDIFSVEISMERFLAELIVRTGDINDRIYDGNINALLEFYGFLEDEGVVEGLSDLEDEVEEFREDYRKKMHDYNLVRRTGNEKRKEKARDRIFEDLLWF